jgi:hexosaminidase
VWTQPGLVKKDDEKPFVDEGYFYRQPVRVALAEGWNRILIKAPHAAPDWKWMFTCVPVTLDGDVAREVEGLKFSESNRHRNRPRDGACPVSKGKGHDEV